MSETNSLNLPDQATDGAGSKDSNTMPAPDTAGHALFERIGSGGMGEVFRCGDDALRRDLAIKVLKPELHGDADAEERFLREARLTGALQHPGIVPIHNLGRLADGRLFYTMKLVRGRTLADLLRDEPDGPERLPRLLAVVEKVCQAMAFAHSKGVIHRDLKPSNVMVGEFGEVQVMDWGLAKELSRIESVVPPGEATENVETVGRVEESAGLSRAGAALGTPEYMPPEQAAGDWDIVDERADVFALGAILCQILTGWPPYHGASRDDLLRRARRGDLAEALGRLEKCGADAALVDLCRDCLAAAREGRPRHAGVVAERLASYQAEVRERLRQAELERARAEVQALEERKRRRWQAALALAALLMLAGVAAVWWQGQRRQAEADGAALQVMGETRALREQARADPLSAAGYDKAVLTAEKAGDVARTGGASETVRRQADELLDEVTKEAEAAAKDRRLLARLLEVRGPREGPKYSRDDKGMMTALAEPTAEEQFASAFRDWGLDVDTVPTAEAVARLKARPTAVVTEVIAALDEWANQRRLVASAFRDWELFVSAFRNSGRDFNAVPVAEAEERLKAQPAEVVVEVLKERAAELNAAMPELEAAIHKLEAGLDPSENLRRLDKKVNHRRLDKKRKSVSRVAELAAALDAESGSLRRELRAIMARGQLPLERALGVLSAALRPVPVPVAGPLGKDHRRLRELAEEMDPAKAPVLGLLTLTRALRVAGEEASAERLLRAALTARPQEVVLYHTLGQLLQEQEPPRWSEAVECFRAARVARPELGVSLAQALLGSGRDEEGLALLSSLVRKTPTNPLLHFEQACALDGKGRWDEAMAEYRQTIELDPTNALAHINLGAVLCNHKRDYDRAIACFRQALELDPKYARAHNGLGNALYDKHDLDGAIACYQKAIVLDPKDPEVHNNLGASLLAKGDRDGAIVYLKKALELDPKLALAHNNLGILLKNKGDLDGASASYKKALELDPKYIEAHYNLGKALQDKDDLDGAIASYKKALNLDPKLVQAHSNLGIALLAKGDLDGAVACCKKALDLDPKHAQAWSGLGVALLTQGRYAEARDAIRRFLALLPSGHPLQRSFAQRLRSCEQYLVLDDKLPAILQGEISPANPGEALTLAQMCQQHKRRHVAAVRLYADAFAAEPKLAADHRYNAACSAALAAAGEGEDARLLPDKVVTMFRHWALGWLRADLMAYAKLAEQNNAAVKQTIQQRLSHWRRDPDLATVRDRLPENERAAWQTLWRDVDELTKKVEPTQGRKELKAPEAQP